MFRAESAALLLLLFTSAALRWAAAKGGFLTGLTELLFAVVVVGTAAWD
jgi:hypothetical protein